eukprot:CCRYP_017826-RA/>CCRYP_017826-RA protein AED:0.30 eAED:0.30 QI:633/1/1/1/0.5/0.66/3/145/249
MAAERMANENKKKGGGLDLGNLGDFGDIGEMMKDLDPATLQELMMEGLKDPQVQEMFSGMQGAMEELMKMDSEQLKAQMEEAMNMLTSEDIQQNIMSHKEEVLAMMEAQGTATAEEIAEYRADPNKFEQAMSEAFIQMKEIFSDPKNMEQVTQMIKGFGAIMQDPVAAMSKLGGVLKDALSDDDKIEEARLQLLSDPTVAGNKAMSDMFGTDEMKEILNDPVKWRKSVKEGQKMLMGRDNNLGLGMGEL